MMKFALAFLVVLPLVYGAPDRKFVLDSFGDIFNSDAIKQDLQLMVDAIGSDPTEALCESECQKLTGSGLLSQSCPLICHEFQLLVQHYKIIPDTTTMKAVTMMKVVQ